jgi:hypothetical protein
MFNGTALARRDEPADFFAHLATRFDGDGGVVRPPPAEANTALGISAVEASGT